MSSQSEVQTGSALGDVSWPPGAPLPGAVAIPELAGLPDDRATPRSTYKIGAVSRLTGITTHTLRKWENRYAMVRPERTAGGDRLYSREDVRKLLLVKDLTQAGMALAKVSAMSVDELARANDEVFASTPGLAGPDAGEAVAAPGDRLAHKVAVTIVGPSLAHTLGAGVGLLDHFDLRLTCSAATDFLTRESFPPTDALVWECPHLQLEDRDILLTMMARAGAVCGIVIFGFGARDHINALRSRNVSLLRGPLDADEVQRIALGMMYDLRWRHAIEV